MNILLITIVFAAIFCVLVLNFYFRVRVLKAYKYLIQNRVDFNATDIFSNEKVKAAADRYPQHADYIYIFINNIRRSVQLASVLIILITAFVAILMFSNS